MVPEYFDRYDFDYSGPEFARISEVVQGQSLSLIIAGTGFAGQVTKSFFMRSIKAWARYRLAIAEDGANFNEGFGTRTYECVLDMGNRRFGMDHLPQRSAPDP